MRPFLTLLIVLNVSIANAQAPGYREWGKSVEKVISTAASGPMNSIERTNLRALRFHLNEYHKYVAAGDFKRADSKVKEMNVMLQRSESVAAVAPQRAAAVQRAEQERRHREVMRQRERHHAEAMYQQRQQHYDTLNRYRRR